MSANPPAAAAAAAPESVAPSGEDERRRRRKVALITGITGQVKKILREKQVIWEKKLFVFLGRQLPRRVPPRPELRGPRNSAEELHLQHGQDSGWKEKANFPNLTPRSPNKIRTSFPRSTSTATPPPTARAACTCTTATCWTAPAS